MVVAGHEQQLADVSLSQFRSERAGFFECRKRPDVDGLEVIGRQPCADGILDGQCRFVDAVHLHRTADEHVRERSRRAPVLPARQNSRYLGNRRRAPERRPPFRGGLRLDQVVTSGSQERSVIEGKQEGRREGSQAGTRGQTGGTGKRYFSSELSDRDDRLSSIAGTTVRLRLRLRDAATDTAARQLAAVRAARQNLTPKLPVRDAVDQRILCAAAQVPQQTLARIDIARINQQTPADRPSASDSRSAASSRMCGPGGGSRSRE